MKKLREKLRNRGGFTLIEMLIVVAIIAILIAIAIPLVNSALEKSREATDAANERAALGAAMVAYMTNEPGSDDADATGIDTAGGTGYYVVDENGKGRLEDVGTGSETYGKGTAAGEVSDINAGKIIRVVVTPATLNGTGSLASDEDITIDWVVPSAATKVTH